jgi:hypothetical protein
LIRFPAWREWATGLAGEGLAADEEETHMQTVMLMRWAGVTPEQYEEARSVINWEGDVPDGAVLHVAGFDGDDLRVTDVWESQEHFQRFTEERLMPGVQQIGIAGEPEVRFYPVQNIFNPRVPTAA